MWNSAGHSAILVFQSIDDAFSARKRLWTLWSTHCVHEANWAWCQVRFLENGEASNSSSPRNRDQADPSLLHRFTHPDGDKMARWWRPVAWAGDPHISPMEDDIPMGVSAIP